MQVNATKHKQVERLLDHLERGPTWRFHALLRVCALTNQEHVVHMLGFDPEVYRAGWHPTGGTLTSRGGRGKPGTLIDSASVSYS